MCPFLDYDGTQAFSANSQSKLPVTVVNATTIATENVPTTSSGSHQYDEVDYRYDDSFDDDDDDDDQIEGCMVDVNINSNQETANVQIVSNNCDIDFNDFSDDSFESDDEFTIDSDSVNDFNTNHSMTSTNIASLSSNKYCKSPQLYTVRIMDLEAETGSSSHSSMSSVNLSINRFAQNRLNIIYELIATEESYIKDIYFTLEVSFKFIVESLYNV